MQGQTDFWTTFDFTFDLEYVRYKRYHLYWAVLECEIYHDLKVQLYTLYIQVHKSKYRGYVPERYHLNTDLKNDEKMHMRYALFLHS